MPLKEKEAEEYELIAVSPLRRMEKRLEELEHTSATTTTNEMFKELVDIVRMNQQIVDELARANDALRIELSKIPGKLDELISHLSELLSYIKASAAEDVGSPSSDSFKPVVEKLNQLFDSNKKIAEGNQSVLTALEDLDKKLRRPAMPMPAPMQKPMMRPRVQ